MDQNINTTPENGDILAGMDAIVSPITAICLDHWYSNLTNRNGRLSAERHRRFVLETFLRSRSIDPPPETTGE
jgi:hypothetical protein